MTQSNENGNGSRLDRLEAIMLDLASATVRHDNEFSRINSTLAQIAEQQQDTKTHHDQEMEDFRHRIQHTENLLNMNAEQLNTLTAGLLELRSMVADYLHGRNQA